MAGIWALAAALLSLVVLQFVAHDDMRLLALLNAQTVWVFLPAYLLASAALCFRRWGLAVVAAAVVVFHATSLVGSIGDAAPISRAAREAPSLRVVSANVYDKNERRDDMVRELLESDADILLVQEVTRRWDAIFEEAGFADRYPYWISEPAAGTGGQAVFSRLPFEDTEVTYSEFWPTIGVTVDVGGTPVHLVNVHLIGPAHGIDAHRRTARALESRLEAVPELRIVGGDFNATPYNETMHRFADLGLDSAHERRGRGLATTWPNGLALSPPIRLDHVLVDDGITVLHVEELRGSGSDHAPVLADLAITG